jgi:DNA-binding MarR family transcriptional regulator
MLDQMVPVDFGNPTDKNEQCDVNVADFIFDMWRLQHHSKLFRHNNRDMPWLVYLRKCALQGRNVTISEIGGIIGASYPTVRKILSMYEDLGFVEIRKDEVDRRKSVVCLSDTGEGEMAAVEREVAAMVTTYFVDDPADEERVP